ncbi:unnamed protein product [Musa acuminata subsp. burmannicoides]
MRTSPSLFRSLVFLSLLRSVFPVWIGKQDLANTFNMLSGWVRILHLKLPAVND